MADNFVKSPMDWQSPPTGLRGGPGKYNGTNDQGLPTRTNGPNSIPEKIYDENVPLPKGQD